MFKKMTTQEKANPPHRKSGQQVENPHRDLSSTCGSQEERPWLLAVKEREAAALYTDLAVKEKGPQLFIQICNQGKGAAALYTDLAVKEGGHTQHLMHQKTIKKELPANTKTNQKSQIWNWYTKGEAASTQEAIHWGSHSKEREEWKCVIKMLEGRVLFIVRERG
jgi:hypothetical protein